MSEFTLAELSKGLEVEIRGDETTLIHGVASLQSAALGQISFLNNSQYKPYLQSTQASAVILHPDHASACKTNMILTANPYFVYAKIADYFQKKQNAVPGIHPSAVLGKSCNIHETASIAAQVVIGDRVKIGAHAVIGPGCVIGDDVEIGNACLLDAKVVVYFDVKIGNRVHVSSGAIIGSDGFGFAMEKGAWHKVPQLGRVILEDDVDIGANTCIDRGAIGDTIIRKGAKLDNLIQIGHNVKIGEHTVMAGCTGIAGSTEVGRYCMIGGSAGIAGHLKIADKVILTANTKVMRSIDQPGMYSSGIMNFKENKAWRKDSFYFNRLPELFSRVKSLEKANQENALDEE